MYTGITSPEHRLMAKKVIEANRTVQKFIDPQWLKRNLLSAPKKIEEVNPLLYAFANPFENKLLLKGIDYLSLDGVRGCCGLKDKYNVWSTIREIQTYAVLRDIKANNLTWKPVFSSGKRGDIRCNAFGQNVYIEIFCINENILGKYEQKLIDEIRERLDNLNGNPFSIWANIKQPRIKEFPKTKNDIEKVWKFLKSEVQRNRKKRTPLKRVYTSTSENGPIIEFEFRLPNKVKKGYFAGCMKSIRFGLDLRRIKSKVIEKIEKFQFPAGKSINGFVIFFEDFALELEDIFDAVLGTTKAIFSERGLYRLTRGHDGVLHSGAGAKLLKGIDFILVSTHPNFLTQPGGFKLVLNSYRKRITEREIERMFGEIGGDSIFR